MERWGDPGVDDRHGGGGQPPRHRRRRRRRAELPPRGGGRGSRRRPARRCSARSRSAGPPTRRAGCSRRSRRRACSAGYLEDLCYTPKTLKAIASVAGRGDRRRHVGPLARDASRAALGLVLGRPADRRRRDHRPRLPLHRDHPQLRRQGRTGRSRSCATPTRSSTRSPTRTTRSRSSASSRARSASSRSAGRSAAGWTCATRSPAPTARSG